MGKKKKKQEGKRVYYFDDYITKSSSIPLLKWINDTDVDHTDSWLHITSGGGAICYTQEITRALYEKPFIKLVGFDVLYSGGLSLFSESMNVKFLAPSFCAAMLHWGDGLGSLKAMHSKELNDTNISFKYIERMSPILFGTVYNLLTKRDKSRYDKQQDVYLDYNKMNRIVDKINTANGWEITKKEENAVT